MAFRFLYLATLPVLDRFKLYALGPVVPSGMWHELREELGVLREAACRLPTSAPD